MTDILKALKKLEEISEHDFSVEICPDGSCALHRYRNTDTAKGRVNDYETISDLLTEMNNIIAGKNDEWLED